MIRPYADADLPIVVEVWYEASLVAHPFLSDAFLATERRELADVWLDIAECFVYQLDDRVVGFVALVGNEVGGLFVHPDHQRGGIGRALVDHVRGSRPFLEVEVFEANRIGRRFYDGYGFRPVGRHVHEATGLAQLRLRLE